jgi:hypothetical protein
MKLTKEEKQKLATLRYALKRIQQGFEVAESSTGCIWPTDAYSAMQEIQWYDYSELLEKVSK